MSRKTSFKLRTYRQMIKRLQAENEMLRCNLKELKRKNEKLEEERDELEEEGDELEKLFQECDHYRAGFGW